MVICRAFIHRPPVSTFRSCDSSDIIQVHVLEAPALNGECDEEPSRGSKVSRCYQRPLTGLQTETRLRVLGHADVSCRLQTRLTLSFITTSPTASQCSY